MGTMLRKLPRCRGAEAEPVESVDLDEPERWQQALHGLAHGYWHTWTACKAASLSAGAPAFLCVSEAGGHRSACPVLQREWRGLNDFTTPIGFSGWVSSGNTLPATLPAEWAAFAASRKAVCAYLALHPLHAPPWPAGGEMEVSALYVLDLAAPPGEWLQKIDGERRRAIRAWEQSGQAWVRDRAELGAFVLQHHASFMRSVGASAASFHTPDALALLCADPHVELVGAADAEGVCTVAGFGETPSGCEMMFHISIREGRRCTSALVWWAVQHFHARGVRFLNLGGSARPGDTLAFAKRRYRPREVPFQALKQVFDRDVYERLCREAGRPDPDFSGYFPAYRAAQRSAALADPK
jgi:hypothetical protein